jgi:hypothetical protein
MGQNFLILQYQENFRHTPNDLVGLVISRVLQAAGPAAKIAIFCGLGINKKEMFL